MSKRQSTVILFLLNENGIPNFTGENYLCSLIETPQKGSFSPTDFTFNCADIRAEIIKRLQQFTDSEIQDPSDFREICEAIWSDLGISSFFERLVSTEGEVTFLTNDPAIPWEWASQQGEEAICSRISCGNVFFEQMKEAGDETKKQSSVVAPEERIKKMKALLIFDEGNTQLGLLPDAKNEIHAIKEVLLAAGLKDPNIKIVDGTKQGAEAEFLRNIRQMREDLGIIHFAGHVKNGDMCLSHSSIESKEIYDIFSTRKTKLPRTLVFINGCESGQVEKVWDKSKSLATAWLHAGASNIVGCRLPIDDELAEEFAVTFYTNLLERKNTDTSIGNVLKDTRAHLLDKRGFDAAWLQYTLFGHAYIHFFDTKEEFEQIKKKMVEAMKTEPSFFGLT